MGTVCWDWRRKGNDSLEEESCFPASAQILMEKGERVDMRLGERARLLQLSVVHTDATERIRRMMFMGHKDFRFEGTRCSAVRTVEAIVSSIQQSPVQQARNRC